MQVTNILFRLGNLLDLQCSQLNSEFQTVLNYKNNNIALSHLLKNDNNLDSEELVSTLSSINNLFATFFETKDQLTNYIVGCGDEQIKEQILLFENNFTIKFIDSVEDITSDNFVNVDENKLFSLTKNLPVNMKFQSFDDLIDKLDKTQKSIYLPELNGKKVAVIGPAGTGKTILAASLAKKQDNEGKKVLFLTYNIKLANYIKDLLNHTSVEVYTAHRYFAKVLIEASNCISDSELKRNLNLYKAASFLLSHESQGHSIDYGLTSEWYEEKLASFYIQSIHLSNEYLYDSIIIDEMQLFPTWWLTSLTEGLKFRNNGTFAIFGDPLQDVYGSKNLPDWLDEVKELKVNYRNSIEIYTFLEKLVDLSGQTSLGTSIQDINKLIINDNDEILNILLNEIQSHIQNNIPLSKITILCINSKTKKTIENFDEIKEYIFKGLSVDSVRKYTGLENEIVILVIPENAVFPGTINESRNKNYLYVAASRATSILSIVSTVEFFDEYF